MSDLSKRILWLLLSSGFVLVLLALISCGENEKISGNTSELPNAIHVSVTSPDGMPVVGARFYARKPGYLNENVLDSVLPLPDGVTDTSGKLSWVPPDTGRWILDVSTEHNSALVKYSEQELGTSLSIALKTSSFLFGVVKNVVGNGKTAVLRIQGTERLARTDSLGNFELFNLSSGVLTLALSVKDDPSTPTLFQRVFLESGMDRKLSAMEVLEESFPEGGSVYQVDNFEDGDDSSMIINGLETVVWTAYNDSTSNDVVADILPVELRDDFRTGIQTDPLGRGEVFHFSVVLNSTPSSGYSYSGMGLQFTEPDDVGMDFSGLQYVSFYARGTGSMEIQFSFIHPTSPGTWYGKISHVFELKNDWTLHQVPVTDLLTVPYTPVSPKTWAEASSSVLVMNFETVGYNGDSIDFWLDDVTLQGDISIFHP